MNDTPDFYKVTNFKAVLGMVAAIFWFFMLKDLHISLIIDIIMIGLVLILFLLSLISLRDEVYDAECPYCKKMIRIDKNASAIDCPICNERIIIEDYTLQMK